MNDLEKVREAAVARAKQDAKQYNERHIDRPLSIPSVHIDDFSFRVGFDAGAASVSPGWVAGVRLIAEERQRQVEVEGWTPDHDDEHGDNQMATAAMCYIGVTANAESEYARFDRKEPYAWPWDSKWWKPAPYPDRVRNLVKAGALIAAEIDRLQRLAPYHPEAKEDAE